MDSALGFIRFEEGVTPFRFVEQIVFSRSDAPDETLGSWTFPSTKAAIQEEVAFRAKTHQGYISLIEHGQRSPSVVTLSLLAKALDTTMGSIVRERERATA